MFEIVGLCICSACLSLVCCFAVGTACLIPPIVEVRNNYLQKYLPGHVNWIIGGVPCTKNNYIPQASKRLDKRSSLHNMKSTICCMQSNKCPRNIRVAENIRETKGSSTNEAKFVWSSNQSRVSIHRTEMELPARPKLLTSSELLPNQISRTALASKSMSRENTVAESISNRLFQDRIILKRIPEDGVPSNEAAADRSIRISQDETKLQKSSQFERISDQLFAIKKPSPIEDELQNVSQADIALKQSFPVAAVPTENLIEDRKTVDKLSPRILSKQLSKSKSPSDRSSKSGKQLGRLFSKKIPQKTNVNTDSIPNQKEITFNGLSIDQNVAENPAQPESVFGKLSKEKNLLEISNNLNTSVLTPELKVPVAFEVSPRRKTL